MAGDLPMIIMLSFGIFIVLVLVRLLIAGFQYLHDASNLQQHPSLTILAPFTDLAYVIHNALRPLTTTRTEELHMAHDRLGPVIRLGPNRLSFASPAAIKDIYGTGTRCLKGDQYTAPGGTPNILSVVDKVKHAVKRKRMSAAFATAHLVDWEWKIADKVRRLLVQMDANEGEWVNMRLWTNLFTIDAICDIALSFNAGMMEAGTDYVQAETESGEVYSVGWRQALHGVGRALGPIVLSGRWFPLLKGLSMLVPSKRKQWKNAAAWQDVLRRLVRCRLEKAQNGSNVDDLFTCLLVDSKGEPLNLNMEELLSETSHLVDAGSDTTAIALTHVFFFLAKHPDQVARLREEVDAALPSDQAVPTYAQMRSLPYLRACLDEAMRLRPPLSAGLQRKTPPEGCSVAGLWVGGNVNISVAAHVAHRNPDLVGSDPDLFRPERWLASNDESRKRLQRYNLTFSQGGRVCIGKNITYMEQMMLVAAVVKRYEFSLPSEHWQMEREEFFNLWPKSLPLTFRSTNAVPSEVA